MRQIMRRVAAGLFWLSGVAPTIAADLEVLASKAPVVVRAQSEEEDESIVTDRPDFTEASVTVGRGVWQLESGYTFSYDDSDRDGTLIRSHSFPETLLRVGISDDVELRLAWNYEVERTIEGSAADTVDGADDLYLGTKIAIRKQDGLLPEAAVIIAGTVPTGAKAFSNEQVNYGANFLYGWDLEDEWSIGASTGFFTSREDVEIPAPVLIPITTTRPDRHVVFYQSVTCGIPIAESVGMYIEYFGLYSAGREQDFPENYVDGGFTYLVNNDFQLDWRIGFGLNEQAEDLFTGAGFAVRF